VARRDPSLPCAIALLFPRFGAWLHCPRAAANSAPLRIAKMERFREWVHAPLPSQSSTNVFRQPKTKKAVDPSASISEPCLARPPCRPRIPASQHCALPNSRPLGSRRKDQGNPGVAPRCNGGGMSMYSTFPFRGSRCHARHCLWLALPSHRNRLRLHLRQHRLTQSQSEISWCTCTM
jgi:hypothetical protein